MILRVAVVGICVYERPADSASENLSQPSFPFFPDHVSPTRSSRDDSNPSSQKPDDDSWRKRDRKVETRLVVLESVIGKSQRSM